MLTGKQKRYLRSLGVNENALFQIGKDGISDTVVETVTNAFNNRELIKIKVLKTCDEDIETIAFDLAMYTHSEVAQVMGRTFLLYKPSKEQRIILP